MNVEEKNHTLRLLVRGAGITLIGILLIDLFAFLYKLMIARYLGPGAYGQLTIGITILTLSTAFTMVGLPAGLSRFISYYFVQKKFSETKAVVIVGLLTVLPISLLFSFMIQLSAPYIAAHVFHNPPVTKILRIFGWIIPLYALVQLGKTILQGFKRIGHRIIVESFGEHALRFVLAAAVVLIGKGIYGLAIAYLAGMVFALFIALYLVQKVMKKVKQVKIFPLTVVAKELFIFSLPLAFSSIVFSVMKWSDTLMLGYFKDAVQVGLYNVALPLSTILAMSYSAFRNLTLPVMTEFYAKKKIEEVRTSFMAISRWIFLTTFPVFLLMILFPGEIIAIFFGNQYRTAGLPLIILTVGVFINAATGLVAETLQTFGRTKTIFWCALFGTVLNVILNYFFIPIWGMAGAAIATSTSISLVNIIMLYFVQQLLHMRFEYKYYIKYLTASIVPFIVVYVILSRLRPLSFVSTIVGLLVFLSLNAILLFVLKSFTAEDIMIVNTIENKFKIPLSWLKKWMH